MTSKFFFPLMIFLLGFSSCGEDSETPTAQAPSTSINKIMPLGASRVEGARPVFESYRFELWKSLLDGGFTFDYIGTIDDEASYPTFSSQTFDDDHEGRGGWTSGQILSEISTWLTQTGSPDIVLFSSPGGNDALNRQPYEEAVANVNAIIDIIQDKNPNVTIIIEQPAPARSDVMTPALTKYFNDMYQEVVKIAAAQSTSTSTVLPVDMATGFNDSFLADNVHYNEAGAKFIADRYYEVLRNRLQQ
ncbi:MAG: GDSL-type esterase/lipase family protein [Bacteroidota bacterium]